MDVTKQGDPELTFVTVDDVVGCAKTYMRQLSWKDTLSCMNIKALKEKEMVELEM